eukprot:scaffold20958_cov129-Isochrysis_galbana.AAC.1
MSGNTVAGIAGISAGAAVFILIPLAVILLLYWRHRRRAARRIKPFDPHAGAGAMPAPLRKFKMGDIVPQARGIGRGLAAAVPRAQIPGVAAFSAPRAQPQLRGPGPSHARGMEPAGLDPLVFEDVELNDYDWLNSVQDGPRGRFSAPNSTTARHAGHRHVDRRSPSIQNGNVFGSIM